MKFQTKIRLLKHKRYFDIGWATTSMVKTFLYLFGLSSLNVKWTLIFGVVYVIFSYVFGFFYLKYGWYEAEQEIGNIYNRFVKQVRRKVINRKI